MIHFLISWFVLIFSAYKTKCFFLLYKWVTHILKTVALVHGPKLILLLHICAKIVYYLRICGNVIKRQHQFRHWRIFWPIAANRSMANTFIEHTHEYVAKIISYKSVLLYIRHIPLKCYIKLNHSIATHEINWSRKKKQLMWSVLIITWHI